MNDNRDKEQYGFIETYLVDGNEFSLMMFHGILVLNHENSI